MPKIAGEDLRKAVSIANERVRKRLEVLEPHIFSNGAIQTPGSVGWFVAASAKTKVIAKNYSRSALISEEATKLLVNKYKLDENQISYGLPTIDVRETILGKECLQPLVSHPCYPGKYRSYTGHCNNVQNPEWGNANTPYLRVLTADYSDGITKPRISVTGTQLPTAREVSLTVHMGSDSIHSQMTTLTTFFGEFIFHDLAHTAQTAGHKGHRIKCCHLKDQQLRHPECLPIQVKSDDPIMGQLRQDCIDYVRSSTAIRTGCTLGPREQINQVTSFLDGSAIYGSSEEESHDLRKFIGGELKTQDMSDSGIKVRDLLPELTDNLQDCKSSGRARCFKAGDVRVNENLGLTIVHTLFMREHNRIARQLRQINGHWNDDQLFEESRRILVAELQHITYNEFLPSVLGHQMISKYNLQLLTTGFFKNYSINQNPTVENAVASAVFAFIYTAVPPNMERYSQELQNLGSLKMGESFYDPGEIYRNNKFDEYLMGMISQNAMGSDPVVTSEMINAIVNNEALDLVALTIHQGRDHGLAGYTQWRRACNIEPNVEEFSDLATIMKSDAIKKLSKLYASVHDIDLFTGGLAEKPMKGAMVGPTFGCLLGRQFYFLRTGDRFWYENDLPPSAFAKDQLDEIRKTSLARIVCDNGDRTDFVQPSSMIASDIFLNAFQYCSTGTIDNVDLNKWKSNTKASQSMPHISKNLLIGELKRAKREVQSLRETEMDDFMKNKGVAAPNSPQTRLSAFVRPKREAQFINNQSLVLELTTNGLVNSLLRNGRDRESGRSIREEIDDFVQSLPQMDINEIVENQLLTKESNPLSKCYESSVPCDHTTPFRSISGWCNNVNNPEFGKSMRVFDRLLPPAYEDGIKAMRKRAKSGKPLPSPRLISTTIHDDISSPHVRYALATMQWGQFLDHDLTFTPMYMGAGETLLDCKDCLSRKTVHSECNPIPIPKNDPFFPAIDKTTGAKQCLHFVRSLNGQTTLGPREQMNQITAYLDGSNVYGSDICEANSLRTFQGGRLNTTRHPVNGLKDLLPQTSLNIECKAPSGYCFKAGDMRASEQPSLAGIHTMFMRQHNRLVDGLAKVNPHWNDEQLYHNGRRILGSISQQISYGEFLPRIIGRDNMQRFGLSLQTNGYYRGYDPQCSATIFNEFAAAVFRFGHSLLKPHFERLDRNYRSSDEPLTLRTAFFNSDMLYTRNAMDNIIRGIATQSAETLDHAITEEVTNHLLEDLKKPFSGMDLISLNIQRARDHGIPPYNEYRRLCNLTKAKKFDDLLSETPKFIVERYKKIYESVDDIDLFSGGIPETPVHGGVIGPTFACIIGMQFARIKKCDRFW
ncbi:peroxidasin homolog pxn-1-like [Oppia nitens]|uniref:peroxidasin homolog pxn-1-like n=1 Tax=Oppia nitens TaxID=1686743 RepID=UPI0023DC47C3|nr:peroxidasin homolog pxn-1-like [Oppia nitens]